MPFLVVRVVWVVLCAALMTWFVFSGAEDIYVPVGYALLALSFPAGLIVVWIWAALVWTASSWLGYEVPEKSAVLLWLGMTAAGYWQWFRLAPRLLQRFRRAT